MKKCFLQRVALLLALGMSLAAAGPALADDHESCLTSGMKQITVLGISPVAKAPINDRAGMSAYLDSIRPDVEAIMARKGMADRTDDVLNALRSGDGVTESQLERGDVIDWMIFRTGAGKVGVGVGPYCLAIQKPYGVFEVALVDEEDLGDSIRRTTHTFVIPKICANLAFGGSTTETVPKPQPKKTEMDDKPAPAPTPPPPPPPPAPPAPADPEPMIEPEPDWDSRWTLRGFPLTMNTDDDTADTVAVDFSERSVLSMDGGTGFGFAAEYRPNARLGIEGALLYAQVEPMLVFDSFTEWLMDDDDNNVLMLTVGPNLHFAEGRRADVYAGVFVGLAMFDDPSFDLGGTIGTVNRSIDDEFFVGAQLGVDVPFGSSGWAFHASGRYLGLSADVDGFDLDVNPLIGAIGLAYNF